jgi:hypothetical protein
MQIYLYADSEAIQPKKFDNVWYFANAFCLAATVIG